MPDEKPEVAEDAVPFGSELEMKDTAQAEFTGTHSSVNYENSTLIFDGKSSLVDHPGGFNSFTFDLALDETDAADLEKASVVITVDINSAFSDSEKLTGHLLKEDFFDAANYPEATFTSTSIEHLQGSVYLISGLFTLKGVALDVILDGIITDDSAVIQYDIPRKEFGVGNDSYGDKLLAEFIPVTGTVIFE